MFEMACQPMVRRVAAARFQHPGQFCLQLSGSGPHTVAGNLAALLAVSQCQARLQQMLYGAWEGTRRWRSDLRHLPASLQQMGQAALMEREPESVVGHPAVVNQKSIILGAQNHDRLLVSAARQNGVYGHLRAHRHVQPLEPSAHLPAGFVHAVHRSLPRDFQQSVIGGLRAARHPRQCPIQPSTTNLQPESIEQDLSRMPQR